MSNSNPQAEQMSADSMVRTLRAQTAAIWRQERTLLKKLKLPPLTRVLDLGCGTGEFSSKFLGEFPEVSLLGVDLDEAHLQRAEKRCAEFGERADFRIGDALDLKLPKNSFELVVCRHLLQAIPNLESAIAGIGEVLVPGGQIHFVAEDYGMIHFYPTELDCDKFWREGAMEFAKATGSDLTTGRQMFSLLSDQGFTNIKIDYLTVDTIRVEREIFAQIWLAWKEGYAAPIAEHSVYGIEEVNAHFDDMIACLRNPRGYGLWSVPVVRAQAPG